MLVVLISATVLADEKSLPDFSKTFPDETLFTQSTNGTFETYGYLTDRSFSDLKSVLQLYLGEGWIEVKQDPDDEKGADKQMEYPGTTLVGSLIYYSPELHVNVGFTMMAINGYGKKYLANITVAQMKAEHIPPGGRGEAPRP